MNFEQKQFKKAMKGRKRQERYLRRGKEFQAREHEAIIENIIPAPKRSWWKRMLD